jgi:hypothetical protein
MSPWYPLDKRLSEPQSRSVRGGEEKNSQSCRESNSRTPMYQYVFVSFLIYLSRMTVNDAMKGMKQEAVMKDTAPPNI